MGISFQALCRMELLNRALHPPLQPGEGCLCSTSDEEDVADRALQFRVRTQKQQLQQQVEGGGPRPQQVVDKPIAWGPTVMPLNSVLGPSEQAEAPKILSDKRSRTDIEGARDCFVLKCVLSLDECQRLVKAAEAQGFEYWAKEVDEVACSALSHRGTEDHIDSGSSCSSSCNSSNDKGSSRISSNRSGSSGVSKRVNHNYRSAHTLEVEHPELADLIWLEVERMVASRIFFSWVILDSENTWPLLADFHRSSGYKHKGGGETTILSDLQKELPFKTDSSGRFVADTQCVLYRCKAETGNALLFYHTQMHEGRPVGQGSVKYIIRTDIMYRRKEPLFTSPADRKAFALWQEAQLLAEKGETDPAAQLFRQMTKVSPELAHYYGM